ncbi:MAG: tRNA (adenosine(37)-N6)-dimethylallyltransferase MiaA [Melioribacteraceae bacterium]|nr:tRNA (adenosine(37)-N6)-dimethylallyltransferase MiaA [Melioribacteraceae bacterium]
MDYNLLTILGPTAAGKTRLSAQIANRFNGEILSADSRQVYIGMDIGTGKDIIDYSVGDFKIPYHLIDIISPKDEFSMFQFRKMFYESFLDIKGRNKLPILAGGTGLFIHSILKNYSMQEVNFSGERFEELSQMELNDLIDILKSQNVSLHNTTDLTDKKRIIKAILIAESNDNEFKSPVNINSFVIGVRVERSKIKENIKARLKERLENGMIDEAKKLIADGITYKKLHFFGLEYKYLALYLSGELNYNDMQQKLYSAICEFAKKQMTWFRKMEKEGIIIHWIEGADFNEAEKLVKENFGL